MAVHEGSDVPGLLLAQSAAFAQRHVGLNEPGRVGQLVHAGAPVERLWSPQRGKHLLVASALAQAIGAVAQRAVLRIHLFAACVIGRLLGFFELGVAAARQRHAHRRAFGKPERVGLQRRDDRIICGRRLAVHAVFKAALDA